MTNPPYSEDHIELLLEFVTMKNNNRPFCLLMPNWVARKKEYSSLIGNANLFYLSPVEAYTYTMPSWNEKPSHVSSATGQTTPYLSSWYICLNNDNLAMEQKLDKMAKLQKPKDWVVAKTIKGLKWKIQKVNKEKKR
jgi:hypothetical protein